RDPTSAMVPGVRPVYGSVQSGDVATPDDDGEDEETATLAASLADPLLWEGAGDDWFGGHSWADDLAGGVARCGVVARSLGGWWGTRPTETEPRKRQRFVIERI